MTDEELDAIEVRHYTNGSLDGDVPALIEEVRRLRQKKDNVTILRSAIMRACGPLQGAYQAVPCPDCHGTLVAHTIGCEVWSALYGSDEDEWRKRYTSGEEMR